MKTFAGFSTLHKYIGIIETNNGKTVRYEYDANNNQTKIIYPSGKVVEKNYDALARLSEIKVDASMLSQYQYAGLELSSQLNANSTKTQYSFDEMGRLATLGANTYEYDTIGNITTDGQDHFQYDEISRLTGVNYDDLYDRKRNLVNQGYI